MQPALTRLCDSCDVAGLKAHFEAIGDSTIFDHARLQELQYKEVDHTWLWVLSTAHGPTVEDEREFVEAVRVRVKAGGPEQGGVRLLWQEIA